jgi:hypothetical protein
MYKEHKSFLPLFFATKDLDTKATFVFKDPEVAETLSIIHDKYVVVPVDKAPNNIVFICIKHYIDCLKI